MSSDLTVTIHPDTVKDLKALGFESAGSAYLPTELFDLSALTNVKSLLTLSIGGLLVGFGARYAGGCTSGHAISGLSNLQLPSLIAVIGFFIGGLTMIHLIFPIIFFNYENTYISSYRNPFWDYYVQIRGSLLVSNL